MAAQQGGQEGADKNAYYILWVIALVALVCGLIWHFFDHQLKQFFLALRVFELSSIHLFFGLFPADLPWLGENIQKLFIETGAELNLAKELTPDTISQAMAEILSVTTGEYLRYPLAIYLIFLSMVVFKTNVQMRLKKKFNMKTLAAQEQVNWPQIKIATKVDVLNQDLDSGPWAMLMSPIQFAKKNKLVTVTFAELKGSQFAKNQEPEFKLTLDPIRTERAFAAQLGRTWQGFEAMPPHRRAIFAVCAARGSRDTKAAANLVSQLANSAADGKLDTSGANVLWKKHAKNTKVKEACEHHAYEFTVLISMILYAREDGVLASADFLWVKPLDRRMWYVLNNVGRQTPGVEVGGIFCHWYYEMALKSPLSAPRVDGAITGLSIALSELIYIPDEKEKAEIMNRQQATEAEAKESKESMEQL